ncbi:MAG: phosphopyruvate hydratase [Elusimicrobia bacterium]|nr:phosphopyruvate hydratase [Elusimicrobiota bacterium]
MDTKIKKLVSREILDSRGFPTIETDVYLADGSFGRAAVPSGASTGTHEALELRDGGKRFMGKGVAKAVENVIKRIMPEIVGLKAEQQENIDAIMNEIDGTSLKTKLGANAILSVSMAIARASANAYNLPLYAYIRKTFSLKEKGFIIPTPMLNIINGGKHADSGINIQEFMIVPVGASNFAQAMKMSAEVYHCLKGILSKGGYTVSVGDEGGFAPKIFTHEAVIETISDAIKEAGYTFKEIKIALDSAANEFFTNGSYVFESHNLSFKSMTERYVDWKKHFPIVSYEDPLAEDDWEGWNHLTKQLGKKALIIGDDLFVTNPIRLQKGFDEKVANAVLIKLNQIGSLSETIEVIKMAHNKDYATVISHRSGETEDSFIADLAVAVNAGAIKTGAPCRSERLSKYNQLIRIEEELGKKAKYAKDMVFKLK